MIARHLRRQAAALVDPTLPRMVVDLLAETGRIRAERDAAHAFAEDLVARARPDELQLELLRWAIDNGVVSRTGNGYWRAQQLGLGRSVPVPSAMWPILDRAARIDLGAQEHLDLGATA